MKLHYKVCLFCGLFLKLEICLELRSMREEQSQRDKDLNRHLIEKEALHSKLQNVQFEFRRMKTSISVLEEKYKGRFF